MSLVKIIFPLSDFLYILQLEEYNIRRYLRQVTLRIFKRNFAVRDSLKYTPRIFITVVLFVFIYTVLLFILVPTIWKLILFLALLPVVTPYLIAISSILAAIPISIAKSRKLMKAHRYFEQRYPETLVIGITGSFGKTTAKYLLRDVLQYDFQVDIIPDNINTSLGIADFILKKNVPKSCEILIVEMGAYTRGDIAESTIVTPPDYAIMTIYGDQHLERFGSRKNLILGKSEIFLNHNKTVGYVSIQSFEEAKEIGLDVSCLVSTPVPQGEKATSYLVKRLALDLGVSEQSIDASIDAFTPPDRRNNIFLRQGVTIIDNSYNISPMVAETMVHEAVLTAEAENKSLVVLTGGIGEQGKHTRAVNQQFAKLLNKYATRVLVNNTVYEKFITPELTIPYEVVNVTTEITDSPAEWLDPESEVLLWLTGHGDLAYV